MDAGSKNTPSAATTPPPSTGLGDLGIWLAINKKPVIIGTLGVAILVAAIFLYLHHESQRETRASQALSEVRTPIGAGAAPLPGSVEGYLRVAREFPGSDAAGRAVLMAASSLFLENKFAQAQAEFERFGRDYASSPWLSQAALGVAKSLEAQNKNAEAITKFEDVRKRFPNTPVADEATLAVARLYEMDGKTEEAIKLYHGLSEAATSSIGARAGFRKEVLLKKEPQLTNAIAPIMATAADPLAIMTNAVPAPVPVPNTNIVPIPTPGAPNAVPTNVVVPVPVPPSAPSPPTVVPPAANTPNAPVPVPAPTPGQPAPAANDAPKPTPAVPTPTPAPAPAPGPDKPAPTP